MSRVFILGAGASYGDQLDVANETSWKSWFTGCDISKIPQPPLITDFFTAPYLQYRVKPPSQELQKYVRDYWGIPASEALGQGIWREVNLEDIFTSATIREEFHATGTDEQARTHLLLNEIKQHIGSVLAACTAERRGRFSKMLVENLRQHDTIINFNYDLLVDAELFEQRDKFQYSNFSDILLDVPLIAGSSSGRGNGLYLKMHGSLNWFACPNQFCPKYQQLKIVPNIEEYSDPIPSTDFCLYGYISGARGFSHCEGCQSYAAPVLIPPLLNKQILTTPVFRCVWGNALRQLNCPSSVVVIGYSFPKTDFYSDWLLRNVRLDDEDIKVVIVNPANDPGHPEHRDFSARMRSIFRCNYSDQFTKFEQFEEILDSL